MARGPAEWTTTTVVEQLTATLRTSWVAVGVREGGVVEGLGHVGVEEDEAGVGVGVDGRVGQGEVQPSVPRSWRRRSKRAWEGLITYGGVFHPLPPPVIRVSFSVFQPKLIS